MRKWYKNLFFSALLAIVAASVSGQVLAQASECGKERGKTSGALDELTYKKLNDIFEDVGNEKYDVAYEKLVVMIKRSQRSNSEYLKATLFQMISLGFGRMPAFQQRLTPIERWQLVNYLRSEQ